MTLTTLAMHEARNLLDTRQISAVELTEAYLNHIERVEKYVKAFVTITGELAMEQAELADRRIASGNISPLTGIPIQIKDNMCTAGVRTTCSSRILETFIPPYDATVVKRLRDQGAVFLGKGNMDEFAMGSSNENSAFFPTHNPWDLDRVPGGSSGGPAASVAALEVMGALGSDTGGSIRQPASLCGVVGMKPTYGLVSRYGLVAFASSLDQIGPLARNVRDCAALLGVIAGHDPRDSTSLSEPKNDYIQSLNGDIRGLRVGVPKEYFVEGMQPGVEQTVREAVEILERLGAIVDWDASLPSTKYALAVYYILAPSECSANLARYDGVKFGYSDHTGNSMWEELERTRQFGFGSEVKRRIMLGTYSLSSGYYDAFYLKAQKVRTIITREFQDAFHKYDVLVAPTSPTTAFRLGEKTSDPVQMYLSDVCTLPVNISGLPGISVPCGFSNDLPVGLQIIGPALGDLAVLQVAYAYEQATDWHNKWPTVDR
ncbi:MAG: Asp-tRNA(Asn)/Glu-tRNA(Gln) amidotransferase subunit GatA [Chloroflexota bacterium]|nr:Asp-tRNA(Asn)/Glu-tRNA(Gln) amidotransferase subunit GatA [Chloroflexota bacterium]